MNGEITIDFVKEVIRVDFDDDDDYINLLIDVAREYITSAVGECNENKARVRLLILVIVSELYRNREFSVDKVSSKAQYTIRSIITQLSCEEEDNG